MGQEQRGQEGGQVAIRPDERRGRRNTGERSQVTGLFLNVNGLESKAIALEAWLDETEHPPDLLAFVETKKQVIEAPTRLPDYTRVAETGTGGQRNRGVELYVHNQYHHQATVKYAAPQGDALLVDI